MYSYKYPMFCYAADVVITCPERDKFILIERQDGTFAFPGGFVDINETAIQAAYREFEEECGVDLHKEKIELYSLGVFDRVNRDPRQRTISQAFLGITNDFYDLWLKCKASDDAKSMKLFRRFGSHDDIVLAFDHEEIMSEAICWTN